MKAKFTYVGIRVLDMQKSLDFYTKFLGMKILDRSKIEQTKGEARARKDSPFNTEYVVGEGLDHLAFKVEDLDKALHEARQAGYKVVLEMKAKEGRWAYVEDPNGIWIELF
jgi:lactoylglutathione lyase